MQRKIGMQNIIGYKFSCWSIKTMDAGFVWLGVVSTCELEFWIWSGKEHWFIKIFLWLVHWLFGFPYMYFTYRGPIQHARLKNCAGSHCLFLNISVSLKVENQAERSRGSWGSVRFLQSLPIPGEPLWRIVFSYTRGLWRAQSLVLSTFLRCTAVHATAVMQSYERHRLKTSFRQKRSFFGLLYRFSFTRCLRRPFRNGKTMAQLFPLLN